MDISEIEATLMTRLSSLHTDDPDDIIEKMKSILGNDVTKESCRFFLDAANWDLSKALGTFYDCNLDPTALNRLLTQNFNVSTNEMEVSRGVELPNNNDLCSSVIYSPSSVPSPSRILKFRVKNSGTRQWDPNSFLQVEMNSSKAVLMTSFQGLCLWAPLSERVPLPALNPGEDADIELNIAQPSNYAIEYMKEHAVPLVGACAFCLPNGNSFGELIYFTAIPEFNLNRIVYIAGCHSQTQIPSTSSDLQDPQGDEDMS